MYRYPEPVWRQPRPGSHERSARPTSLISEQASRTSARELGPSSATLKLPSVATSGFKAAEDDGYSYSDPAGMYYDTEPAWRRPRAGSPTSRIMERAPRTSARELSPPPAAVEFPFIDSVRKIPGPRHTLSVRSDTRKRTTSPTPGTAILNSSTRKLSWIQSLRSFTFSSNVDLNRSTRNIQQQRNPPMSIPADQVPPQPPQKAPSSIPYFNDAPPTPTWKFTPDLSIRNGILLTKAQGERRQIRVRVVTIQVKRRNHLRSLCCQGSINRPQKVMKYTVSKDDTISDTARQRSNFAALRSRYSAQIDDGKVGKGPDKVLRKLLGGQRSRQIPSRDSKNLWNTVPDYDLALPDSRLESALPRTDQSYDMESHPLRTPSGTDNTEEKYRARYLTHLRILATSNQAPRRFLSRHYCRKVALSGGHLIRQRWMYG